MTLRLFEPAYYLQQNPDVAASARWGADPAGHYQRYGRFEGRNPNPFFDEKFYLAHNLDVAQAVASGAFASGYDHWIAYGQFEDRSPLPVFGTVSTYFSQQYEFRGAGAYFARNPDVLNAYLSGEVGSAWQHYVQYGYAEERTSALGVVAHGSPADDTFNQNNLDGKIQWIVNTGPGNDTVSAGKSLLTHFYAYGDDYIDSGDGNDVVNGDWGQDTIVGSGGNDVLYGGDVPALVDPLFGDPYIQKFEDRFVFGIPSSLYEHDVVGSLPGESFDPTDRLVLPTGVKQSDILTFSDGEDWHIRYVVAGRVQEIELDFLPGQAPAQFDANWLILA